MHRRLRFDDSRGQRDTACFAALAPGLSARSTIIQQQAAEASQAQAILLRRARDFLGAVKREREQRREARRRMTGQDGRLIGQIVVDAEQTRQVAEALDRRPYACSYARRSSALICHLREGVAIDHKTHTRSNEQRGLKGPLVIERRDLTGAGRLRRGANEKGLLFAIQDEKILQFGNTDLVERGERLERPRPILRIQKATGALIDIIVEGEPELYGRGESIEIGRSMHALQRRAPLGRLPAVPVAQRGNEAVSQAIIAHAGACILGRETALRLTKQALMVGDEALYLGMQFSWPQEVQGDEEFVPAPPYRFFHILQAKTHASEPPVTYWHIRIISVAAENLRAYRQEF